MFPLAAVAIPDELLGPQALLIAALMALVFLSGVIRALWKDHLQADADDRAQRDKAMSLAGDMVSATNRMAAAMEARNRRDADTARRTERPR